MTKTTKTFTIDIDIHAKAQAADINMSEAAENGIRQELIRIGGDVKTVDELLVEKEMKERQRKVKEAEGEAARVLAHSQGKMYVDEKSPDLIDISKFQKKRGR